MKIAAAFVAALVAVPCAAAPAAAAPADRERPVHREAEEFRYSGPDNFCGLPDVHRESERRTWWMLNGARSEIPAYMEVVKIRSSFTSTVTGRTVTYEANRMSHDMSVTDNGDGTFTFRVAWSGRRMLLGPDREVLDRTTGTTRWVTVYDVDADEGVSELYIKDTGFPFPQEDTYCDDVRRGLGL